MEMFRLYLLNLIKSGETDKKNTKKIAFPGREEIDRRTYERFDMDHKHMVLMNEQDIFLIRDISKKGFKVEVSQRSFDRLMVDNLYKCRMRYMGEVYECKAQVRWKKKSFVGFELSEDSSDVKSFFTRLILPRRIASSLNLVTEENAIKGLAKKIYWYHGLYKTNIYILNNTHGNLQAWFVQTKDKIVISHLDGAIALGELEKDQLSNQEIEMIFQNQFSIYYSVPVKEHILFLTDIIMASAVINKESILQDILSQKK